MQQKTYGNKIAWNYNAKPGKYYLSVISMVVEQGIIRYK